MNSLKFQDRLLGLQDNLLNFAYMLTANREEAKDLLQDTTLKALDNEDKYIDNVNFKGCTGHRTKCIWVEIEKKEKRFVGQRVVYDDGIKAYKTKCLRGFN